MLHYCEVSGGRGVWPGGDRVGPSGVPHVHDSIRLRYSRGLKKNWRGKLLKRKNSEKWVLFFWLPLYSPVCNCRQFFRRLHLLRTSCIRHSELQIPIVQRFLVQCCLCFRLLRFLQSHCKSFFCFSAKAKICQTLTFCLRQIKVSVKQQWVTLRRTWPADHKPRVSEGCICPWEPKMPSLYAWQALETNVLVTVSQDAKHGHDTGKMYKPFHLFTHFFCLQLLLFSSSLFPHVVFFCQTFLQVIRFLCELFFLFHLCSLHGCVEFFFYFTPYPRALGLKKKVVTECFPIGKFGS